MNIPYETLVLIAASGGAIIIFAIAVAILCTCRHVRRSRKAVIHIVGATTPGAEDAVAETDEQFWERNHLIPTASILHSFNPKAKIHAIRPSLPPTQNSQLLPSNPDWSETKEDVEKISNSDPSKCLFKEEKLVVERNWSTTKESVTVQNQENSPNEIQGLTHISQEKNSQDVQNELTTNSVSNTTFTASPSHPHASFTPSNIGSDYHLSPSVTYKQQRNESLDLHQNSSQVHLEHIHNEIATNHIYNSPFLTGSSQRYVASSSNDISRSGSDQQTSHCIISYKHETNDFLDLPHISSEAHLEPHSELTATHSYHTDSSHLYPPSSSNNNRSDHELSNGTGHKNEIPDLPCISNINSEIIQSDLTSNTVFNSEFYSGASSPYVTSSPKDVRRSENRPSTSSNYNHEMEGLLNLPQSSPRQNLQRIGNELPTNNISKSPFYPHFPSTSNDKSKSNHQLSHGASYKHETVIHLRLQSAKQCSTQKVLKQSRSFCLPNNHEGVQRPVYRNISRAQSFQEGTNAHIHSLGLASLSKNSSHNSVDITAGAACNLMLPSTSYHQHTTVDNHRSQNRTTKRSTSQAGSSQNQRPKTAKQTSRTSDNQITQATRNRRPQRSQSFQERVSPNSQQRQQPGATQSSQQSRRGNAQIRSYRQEVRGPRHRTVVRTRSMLSATQLQSLSAQMLDQPGTALNRNFVCSSAEDVFVLDGSEPPPPYQS